MAHPPLFQPFRALGYITDNVAFAVQRRGREAYVTVSVGRCWQVSAACSSHALRSTCNPLFEVP